MMNNEKNTKTQEIRTIRLTRIPQHHAPETTILRLRLLNDTRQRPRIDVSRPSGRATSGRADVHFDIFVWRSGFRPVVPGEGIGDKHEWRRVSEDEDGINKDWDEVEDDDDDKDKNLDKDENE